MASPTISAPDGPILFYDGECGLCARAVRWSLARDRRGVLRYAPLQGETYARLAVEEKPRGLLTVVLHDADGLHLRSDAVLRLLRHLGGVWRVFGGLGRMMPRRLRDVAYDFVARRRLRWFGTADRCRVPTPAERGRFLG
jgi:predicted DCC family thiol-disulfide oxidoreductase YuxK